MKKIFLESHNIKNLYFGFGQFNYNLIKALDELIKKESNLRLVANVDDKAKFKNIFSSKMMYKKYKSLQRYPLFRIKEKYDLWHSLNQNTKIEPFFDLPYVLTVHDVNFIDENSSDLTNERNVRFQKKLNRSNSIVYISEYAKESTHKCFKVPNVYESVIYNGNPIADKYLPVDYSCKLNFKKEFVFSIGEFTSRKNMKSIVYMISKTENLDLVLAGKDNTKYGDELKSLIKELDLSERVHILGKISENEKMFCYKSCVAFVFPSLREGFGIPPIEAMSYGKPVFLSNNTSLPEIGGKYAFYWDHYEPNYMLDVFKKGMSVYNKNKEDYSNIYIKHARSFSWDKAAKEYLKVYKQVLKIN